MLSKAILIKARAYARYIETLHENPDGNNLRLYILQGQSLFMPIYISTACFPM